MITLMIPYYENPNMLREHIKYWQQYPLEVIKQLLVILVDDGSPRNPARAVLDEFNLPVEIQLYRIKENIPWNFTGARNLGFHVAPKGWVISTDIDHVLTAENMKNLLSLTLDPKHYYRPSRFAVNSRKQYRPHGISWIITRELFWKAGGFNENYAGQRFGAAGAITKALRRVVKPIDLEDTVYFTYFDTNVIADCNTRDWSRKRSSKVRKERQTKDYLRFNWDRVLI